MAASAFAQLLSPGRIGPLELRNRIIVTAMGVNLAEADGTCGERIRAFHEEQARGGVGLVNVGVAGVAWPAGGNEPGQVAISEDRFIPGLAALADAVHRHGAKLSIQLHHGGFGAPEDMKAGRPVWVPCYPEPPKKDITEMWLLEEIAKSPAPQIRNVEFRIMTIEDIRTVVQQFAAAAVRAKRAGADGVEIHAGHGYLLSSFISPRFNKRTDEYGGPLENRVRILLEVVRAIRAAVGPDFAMWCKLDSREVGKEGGITIGDAKRTAKMVEEAGANAITVTAYHDVGQGKLHSASHTPQEPGVNLPYAAQIKAAVGIPVIASGRIEPEVGDAHIATGAIDFVAMGRKLLADPHLPRKLAAGKPQDVLPCIYCYTCISAIYTQEQVRCAVNPETGFESHRTAAAAGTATARKRVVVVGGGPGGMEAARRLVADGHEVVLLERGRELGGTLRFASLAYAANEQLLDWLRRRIEASRVEVRLGTAATPELLRSLRPDAVVVATGARRDMPPLPGSDLPHVFSGDDLRQLMMGESSAALGKKTGWATRLATKIGAATGMTANPGFVRKATHQWMPLGKRIAIVGGELVGLELAEFLSERGRAVGVVDDAPRLGAGLTLVRRMRVIEELQEHGVGLHAGASGITIEPERVRFTDREGRQQKLAADHVIVAKGASGDLALAEELRTAGFTIHTVGDCRGVSYIEGAMRSAAEAAAAISAAA
ncbi:MAG TPA: FAD-dependent oxidoreductase [Steroidobacteraceae bacterium]|nr:FAD-dependent oxidoreductase [Steroidobacteraceae bacterium]HQX46648.1 FAD-dependent oxidoreductase [Steroidobacteraceae bacterium]HQX78673.1 FAD-dependent oxidoreductase [Steroidobacteraceae bacterium]HQZ80549.1 FAD-dependent oxidoreductase [Steroidobacteraceae bacterium]